MTTLLGTHHWVKWLASSTALDQTRKSLISHAETCACKSKADYKSRLTALKGLASKRAGHRQYALMQVAIQKPGAGSRKQFKYDRVFGPDSNQAQVYEDTKALIRSVLDGDSR